MKFYVSETRGNYKSGREVMEERILEVEAARVELKSPSTASSDAVSLRFYDEEDNLIMGICSFHAFEVRNEITRDVQWSKYRKVAE